MYETHFGLKKRPFGSNAEGSGVFVGPQQAKLITSLQKGLGAPDAIVTVTGPVGVGKTTLVDRALETLPTGRTAAHIGRMQMTQEEVVELLMSGFGIKKTTGGSIRRFAAFRRQLQAQSESGIPVAIIIEDAQRLGTDALAEVEALTAADAGDAASANIILMGQPGLNDLISSPDLARLKQRIRHRLKIEPLSSPEVQGYLKHTIREAGGNYEAIFDPGVADIVFACSEGIPRVINTLCETAMTTAMEENSARITAALMCQVAKDAYDYDADQVAVPAAPAVDVTPVAAPTAEEDIDWEAPAKPEPVETDAIDAAEKSVAVKPEIGHDIVVESGCYPVPDRIESPAPVEVAEEAYEVTAEDTADSNAVPIPELINDTQPELPRLDTRADDIQADIPVLNNQAEDPIDESDIESTQTLAQPVGLLVDEAVTSNSGASTTESGDESADDAGEHFDLDAALSPEVESTNVMPGLTMNLDAVALDKIEPTVIQKIIEPMPAPDPEPLAKKSSAIAPVPAASDVPAGLDLPTLSDSMRVDVEKEVRRANELDPPVPDAAASAPKPEPLTRPEPEAVPKSSPEPVTARAPEPEPAVANEPEPEPAPKPAAVTATVGISDATMNAPAMRDPRPVNDAAERESDIDALEAALAAAKNGDLAIQNGSAVIPGSNDVTAETAEPLPDDAPAPVPEITLDKIIAEQQSQLQKLDQFRDEINNVNSLEDVSDLMAETLFGVEFEELAAAAIASPYPPEETEREASPSPVTLTEDEIPVAANDASELGLEQTEVAAEPLTEDAPAERDPLNDSAALRIDILNEMKIKAAAMAENVEMGSDDPTDKISSPKGPQPEPIERQINTSMTQTLEALNVSKMANAVAEEKEEKKSGGLFSRFRKSS